MSRSVVTSRSFFSSSWIFAACPVTRPWPGKTSGAGFEESCSRQRCTRLRAMPRCADTSVKLLPSSTTKRTASFLNCGVNVRRSRVVPFAMDHLRALHGSYLGVHFSGHLQMRCARQTLLPPWLLRIRIGGHGVLQPLNLGIPLARFNALPEEGTTSI